MEQFSRLRAFSGPGGFWYLPTLLDLDQFRPDFIDLLEKTFHVEAEIGHVRAQLVPTPGLYVGRMALLDHSKTPEVLASGSLRVTISWTALFAGRLRFTSIRFLRPRFIIHRYVDAKGSARWVSLTLPHSEGGDQSADVERIDFQNGRLEVWDHATRPATQWVVSDLTGNFQMRAQQGAVTGHVLFLGRKSLLDVHYQQGAAFPVDARLNEVSLKALQTVLHLSLPTLEGTGTILAKARFQPTLADRRHNLLL